MQLTNYRVYVNATVHIDTRRQISMQTFRSDCRCVAEKTCSIPLTNKLRSDLTTTQISLSLRPYLSLHTVICMHILILQAAYVRELQVGFAKLSSSPLITNHQPRAPVDDIDLHRCSTRTPLPYICLHELQLIISHDPYSFLHLCCLPGSPSSRGVTIDAAASLGRYQPHTISILRRAGIQDPVSSTGTRPLSLSYC